MGLLGTDQLWYRNNRAVQHLRNGLPSDIENLLPYRMTLTNFVVSKSAVEFAEGARLRAN